MHGQAGTTGNLLAVAVMSTLKYGMKNMITQTHFNMNNLEAPLITTSGVMGKEYFMDVGIDALARSIKTSPLDSDLIENCSMSFLHNRLNLLPGTTKNNRDIYESDMSKTITGILHAVANYHDLVFIDTNSGSDELTRKIIDQADLVIINLSQNKYMLEDYLSRYEYESKKVFYLIGNYDKNSKYNLNNMKKSYKWLKNKNTAVIPYNTEYKDAQSDGQILEFMLKNLNCDKDESNAFFIREVKTAVDKIMKYAGIERCDSDDLYC